MPLLIPVSVTPPAPPPPPPPREPPIISGRNTIVKYEWHAPSGEILDMMTGHGRVGVQVRPGVAGLGVAPREINRRARHAGGTYGRRVWVDEKIITLPISIMAPNQGGILQELKREVSRLFMQTVPPNQTPKIGRLRVIRANGSWREINAIYYDGLGGTDEGEFGVELDKPVLQLLAMDPWWYEEGSIVVEFVLPPAQNFFNPFLTVSPGNILGEAPIYIDSDVPVSPIWYLMGQADSVTASIPGMENASWTFNNVAAGEVITIDIENFSITDQNGVNRIEGLDWPSSSFFELPPGNIILNVDLVGDPAAFVRMYYRPRREMA